MSAGAPADVGQAVAEAAAALGLERPEVLPLPGGAANRCVRLRNARHDLVLKFAGEAATGLGAHRASEIAMQSLAAGAGLAPAVVLADTARGFLVSRHVAGRTPGVAEMRSPRMLVRVGGWLAQLHSLDAPAGLPLVDIGTRAAGYLRRVLDRAADPGAAALLVELESRRAALPPAPRAVPCHHDLHHRNFVDDGHRLVALDWEYAGPGDAAADLASIIGYHGLDGAAVDALLGGYGDAGAGMRERIAALAWIFDCLWYGWNAAASLAGLAAEPGEQARIAARLAR
jgi:aminoglycoside phosphotransferase (APT) family kinase protein